MGLVIFAFLVIFLLIASGGVILFYREQMVQRLSAVIAPEEKQNKTLIGTIQQSGFSLSGVVEHLERVIPKSQAETGVTQQRLIRAGYRSDSALKLLGGVKVL